jgi:hypothetical protein
MVLGSFVEGGHILISESTEGQEERFLMISGAYTPEQEMEMRRCRQYEMEGALNIHESGLTTSPSRLICQNFASEEY